MDRKDIQVYLLKHAYKKKLTWKNMPWLGEGYKPTDKNKPRSGKKLNILLKKM